MNVLELKNVSKNYKTFKLDNVSFEIPQGCVMGVIGENGAGKSTVIKLILDMISRDSGEIEIFGNSDIQSAKAQLGVVLDEAGYPPYFTAAHVNKIMSKTFEEWNEEHYFGYLSKFGIDIKKKFKEMSRGTKMKFAIAAAISHNAKLLILDEATGGLDPIIRDEILDILYDYVADGEKSILMSSHIISDLEKICDYITFIHNGKIIFSEEKDLMTEKYGILRCDPEFADSYPQNAILGMKRTPLGCELLLDRSLISSEIKTERASIESIMLLMSRNH